MKEIIYDKVPKKEIVDKGVYNGLKYVILNLGKYPTAYVENITGIKDYTDERLSSIDVHGGFSYSGLAHWDKTDKTRYFGWDYGHVTDYAIYPDGTISDGLQWTYEEILTEVKTVIDELIKLEEGVNNTKTIKQLDGFDYKPTSQELCRALAEIIYRRYFKYAASGLYRDYALDMLERFLYDVDGLNDILVEEFNDNLKVYFADDTFREHLN